MQERVISAGNTSPLIANDDNAFGSGKFEVSPVREGLRVIVRPVRDNR